MTRSMVDAKTTKSKVQKPLTAKNKMGIAAVVITPMLCLGLSAQQRTPGANWDSLKFLVGKWVVEVDAMGQPGSGSSTFEAALQGKALIRKHHAEYPATKDRPAMVHDDLTVIYRDGATGVLRAFYTDSDGNVINYSVSVSADGKSAVFLGDTVPAAPRFRLTYALSDQDRMTFTLELAPPGMPDQFQKLVGGTMKRSADTSSSAK